MLFLFVCVFQHIASSAEDTEHSQIAPKSNDICPDEAEYLPNKFIMWQGKVLSCSHVKEACSFPFAGCPRHPESSLLGCPDDLMADEDYEGRFYYCGPPAEWSPSPFFFELTAPCCSNTVMRTIKDDTVCSECKDLIFLGERPRESDPCGASIYENCNFGSLPWAVCPNPGGDFNDVKMILEIACFLNYDRNLSRQDKTLYTCDWKKNGGNTKGQKFLGYASGESECFDMIQSQCPDAQIANMPQIGYGGCYCQYGTLMETTIDGAGFQSCYLSTKISADLFELAVSSSIVTPEPAMASISSLPTTKGFTLIEKQHFTSEICGSNMNPPLPCIVSDSQLYVRNCIFDDIGIAISMRVGGVQLIIENSHFIGEASISAGENHVVISNSSFHGVSIGILAHVLVFENSKFHNSNPNATYALFDVTFLTVADSEITGVCGKVYCFHFLQGTFDRLRFDGMQSDELCNPDYSDESDTCSIFYMDFRKGYTYTDYNPTPLPISSGMLRISNSEFSRLVFNDIGMHFFKSGGLLSVHYPVLMQNVSISDIFFNFPTVDEQMNFIEVRYLLFLQNVTFRNFLINGHVRCLLCLADTGEIDIDNIYFENLNLQKGAEQLQENDNHHLLRAKDGDYFQRLIRLSNVMIINVDCFTSIFEIDKSNILLQNAFVERMETWSFLEAITGSIFMQKVTFNDVLAKTSMIESQLGACDINNLHVSHASNKKYPMILCDSAVHIYNSSFNDISSAVAILYGYSKNHLDSVKINNLKGGGFFMRCFDECYINDVSYSNTSLGFIIADKNVLIDNSSFYTSSMIIENTEDAPITIRRTTIQIAYSASTSFDAAFFRSMGKIIIHSLFLKFTPEDSSSGLTALHLDAPYEINGLEIDCEGFATMCHVEEPLYSSFRCETCSNDEYAYSHASLYLGDRYQNYNPQCLECPLGGKCDGSEDIDLEAGYWAIVHEQTVEAGGSESSCAREGSVYFKYDTYPCPEGYCIGGGSGNCAEGRTGVLCGRCKDGYSQGFGVAECYNTTCNPWATLIINFIFSFGVAVITVRSANESGAEKESSNVFKITMVLLQATVSTRLPYPEKVLGALERSLPLFSLVTIPSGTGTCLAPGITTVSGVLLLLFPVLITIAVITAICIYLQIRDHFSILQISTLTVFLSVSALFNVAIRMLSCGTVIIDESGNESFRAFYFGEVDCFQWYQWLTLIASCIFMILLFICTALHYYIRKGIIGKRQYLEPVFLEMEKPFVCSSPFASLWGYLLIFYRAYMVFCKEGFRNFSSPIIGSFLSLVGTVLLLCLLIFYFPFRGNLSNWLAICGFFGVSILCVFQLGAEIQIRLNDYSDTEWIINDWLICYCLILTLLAPAIIYTSFFQMEKIVEEVAQDALHLFATSQDKKAHAADLELEELISDKDKTKPSVRYINLNGHLFLCACFPTRGTGETKFNVTIMESKKAEEHGIVGMQMFGVPTSDVLEGNTLPGDGDEAGNKPDAGESLALPSNAEEIRNLIGKQDAF